MSSELARSSEKDAKDSETQLSFEQLLALFRRGQANTTQGQERQTALECQ